MLLSRNHIAASFFVFFLLIPALAFIGCNKAQEKTAPAEKAGPAPGKPRPWTALPNPTKDQLADPVFMEAAQLIQRARDQREPPLLDRAENILRDGLAANPQNDRLWMGLGILENERTSAKPIPDRSALEFEKTIANFQKAVSINPGNKAAIFEIAKSYEVFGKHIPAAERFQEIYAKEPENLLALTHAARNLILAGNPEQAAQLLQKRLSDLSFLPSEVSQKQFEAAIQEQLGMAYIALGKTSEAEKILLHSVTSSAKYGGPACAYFALGELYAESGRTERAAQVLWEAAEREPENSLLQERAALELLRAGELDRALSCAVRVAEPTSGPEGLGLKQRIESAISLRETGGPELLRQTLVQLSQGRFEAAHQNLTHAPHSIELDRRFTVVKGFVALFRREPILAEELFAQAEQSADQSIAGRVGRGHISIIRKEYDRAPTHFEPVTQQWKDHFSDGAREELDGRYNWFVYRMACLGMGWLLSNQHRHTEAIIYFDQILSKCPADRFALLGKANALTATNELAKAERLLREILNSDPEDPYALAELALVRLRLGDETEAESAFKKAASVGPDKYTCPFEGLGILYLKQGKPDRAKENFKKAIEMNPGIEYMKFNGLARIYINEGRLEEAKKLLSQSIENYPYDPEAREMLDQIEGTSAKEH
jgi:tetratricopeptide (TPR) repeat protein